jgi:hypothetical protein
MSPVSFTLQVPSDARFRRLAADVASRYMELAGAGEGEGATLARLVDRAVDEVAAEGDTPVEVLFAATPAEIEVVATCGGRTSTVRRPLPAGTP